MCLTIGAHVGPDEQPTGAAKEPEYDRESLHFEAQIDSDLAALDHIPQERDCVDSVAEALNGDGNAKIQSHHVSCEDLLEFADTKPSSRARGNDSDEVRIMSKVLGKEVRLCLLVFLF